VKTLMWVNGLRVQARDLLYTTVAAWHVRRDFRRHHLTPAARARLNEAMKRRTS